MIRNLSTMKQTAAVILAVAVLGGCAAVAGKPATTPTVTVTTQATVTTEPDPEPTPTVETPTPEPSEFVPDEEAFVKVWLEQHPRMKPSIWHDGALSIGRTLCTLLEQQDQGVQSEADVLQLADSDPKVAKVLVAAARKHMCP